MCDIQWNVYVQCSITLSVVDVNGCEIFVFYSSGSCLWMFWRLKTQTYSDKGFKIDVAQSLPWLVKYRPQVCRSTVNAVHPPIKWRTATGKESFFSARLLPSSRKNLETFWIWSMSCCHLVTVTTRRMTRTLATSACSTCVRISPIRSRWQLIINAFWICNVNDKDKDYQV